MVHWAVLLVNGRSAVRIRSPAPGKCALERPAIGMGRVCRHAAQARALMISWACLRPVIIEVSRACRAIMPAGADLGRVLCPARWRAPGVDRQGTRDHKSLLLAAR